MSLPTNITQDFLDKQVGPKYMCINKVHIKQHITRLNSNQNDSQFGVSHVCAHKYGSG